MAGSEIKTTVTSLGELLKSPIISGGSGKNRFRIPPIQRQYQWGPGHIEDDGKDKMAKVFLDDILLFQRMSRRRSDPYYLGTMIVYSEPRDPQGVYALMDGQQRWTTVTSLMGVIYHLLDGDGSGSN